MTSSAFSSPSTSSKLSYARARLLLGISGVGTSVLLATALLVFDLPARLLSTDATQPLFDAVKSVLLLMSLGALVFFPFDVLGGAIVVRQRPALSVFIARWLRGVVVQLMVFTAAVALLMYSARGAGIAAVLATFVLLQLLLASSRTALSTAIASFKRIETPERVVRAAKLAGIDPTKLSVLDTTDEGFVGGWSGINPRRLVLPAHWAQLPDAALVATLYRRRIIAESGAHVRGVLGAIVWNTLGLALVVAASGADMRSAAGLLTTAAGMTLWAFVGVLLLPTPSRAAVFAVDQAAAREVGESALHEAIERLDRWQDDEARRSAGVETIFHPVPSRSARLSLLAQLSPLSATLLNPDARSGVGQWHAHHLARHALWLGWATLSPISRAVHCNVGRPALWAMLPGD